MFVCTLMTVMFFGGWLPPVDHWIFYLIPGFVWFIVKFLLLLSSFVWVRVTFPRYRYDQLMRLGWKIFLPLSLAWVVFIASIMLGCNWLV